MKKTLIPLAVILAISLDILIVAFYFSQDPPIDNVTITDPNKYMDTNRYVKKFLKKNSFDLMPVSLPGECVCEYYYNYQCNFAGNICFTIYLNLCSVKADAFHAEEKRLANMNCKEVISLETVHYYVFEMPDLGKYYDHDYSTRGFVFVVAEFDEANQQIHYLISQQYDNRHIPEKVDQMIKDLA